MSRQKQILAGLAACLLLAAPAAGYLYWSAQRDAAAAARDGLETCYREAARIEQLRVRPPLALEQERLNLEITGLIEQARASAGLPKDAFIRITPEPPSRIGETAYKEKPTLVTLPGVGMEPLVKFVHALVAGPAGLHAKSIHLTAPPDQAAGQWNAEIVFTYLIYEPARKGP